MKGKPLTLVGTPVRPGQKAPDFTVLSNDVSPLTLASTAGKTRIFLSVPSLDTPVCDLEAKTFNKRASEVPNTEVLVISVDLPFAQKRWCAAEGITNLKTGSDHRDTNFGLAYGVLIKETRLLARAAFVVNAAGEVTYAEVVPDIANQPNFDAVIQAAKEAQAVRA
jgi:thiol peroxidase